MNKIASILAAAALLLAVALCGCDDDPVDPTPVVEIETTVITADQYLRNRFFKLDRPDVESPDGRVAGQQILESSIKIFRLREDGPLEPGDIANVAVYVDSLGYRLWNELFIHFGNPRTTGARWQEVTDFEVMRDANGDFAAVDLRASQPDEDVLAVTYTVVNAQGEIVSHVGDDPARGEATQYIPRLDGLYYRMKLLKAQQSWLDPHVFGYALRNIYDLGGRNLDPHWLDIAVQTIDPGLFGSVVDEQGMPYLRIFGLDVLNLDREPLPDGLADIHDSRLFDLRLGLLKFPRDFPHPFAGAPAQYEAYVNDPGWDWEASRYLVTAMAPELYSIETAPEDLARYGRFRIVVKRPTSWPY